MMWNGRRRSVEPANESLELCVGEPATAADVHGTQVASLHEGVHGGSADPEQRGGLLRCQQQRLTCQCVVQPLDVAHLALPVLGSCPFTTGRPGAVAGEGAKSGRSVTAA